jgi:hypothetical protein
MHLCTLQCIQKTNTRVDVKPEKYRQIYRHVTHDGAENHQEMLKTRHLTRPITHEVLVCLTPF